MQLNITYPYYSINDDILQYKLDMTSANVKWSDTLQNDLLYIGEVNNQKILAHSIAQNKEDIIPVFRDNIREADFKLLAVMKIEEAITNNIVFKDELDLLVYDPQKANQYVENFKL